jgi:hypothetical protein
LSQCKQEWRYNKPRELRENPGYFSIDELIRLLKDRNILELSGITKANIEGSYKCMANLLKILRKEDEQDSQLSQV